jgi:hypothetical protein
LLGPGGTPVTSMTHTHDPKGHRHHRSVWVGHRDVNGADFWEEDGGARIVTDRVEECAAPPGAAAVCAHGRWLDPNDACLLEETRTLTLRPLADGEYCFDLAIEFTPAAGKVTMGKTPFGFLGVRVAPAMAVESGHGEILNAEGLRDEAGVLWKRSRWADYAGPSAKGARQGAALFDHPGNPRYPTYFHVRNDGWMGASFCYESPFELAPGEKLKLRYRLYVHGPSATAESIEAQWRRFAAE